MLAVAIGGGGRQKSYECVRGTQNDAREERRFKSEPFRVCGAPPAVESSQVAVSESRQNASLVS